MLSRYGPEPPQGGAALRNWQNIHALSGFGPVDVLAVGVDQAVPNGPWIGEWITLPLERSLWDRARNAAWLVRPGVYHVIDRYRVTSISRWLRQRMAEHRYDVALIEGLTLASYLPDLKRATGCMVVYDAHNVESALLDAAREAVPSRRSALHRLKQSIVTSRFGEEERRAVTEADLVWTCSRVDAVEFLRRYPGAAPLQIVPNGVNLEAYQSGSHVGEHDWSGLPITMVYPGLFSYGPNADAAMRLVSEVLPAVRASGHTARIVFVGRDPTPAMLAAARADPAIEVTGTVPSVLPYLHQPCIVALPITLGSGTRLKIVEAFAAGAPVVSSAKGAEGLDAVDGTHLLIRETAAAMASAVVDLWNRPVLRERLCRDALDLVRRSHSWSAAASHIARSLGVEPAGGA